MLRFSVLSAISIKLCECTTFTVFSLALQHCKRLPGSQLDVGAVPPVSGDPLPRGLCTSPAQSKRVLRAAAVSCVTKAPFYTTSFRDRATAHWFSPGQLQSPVVGFQTSPCTPTDTLIGGDVQVARAWQTYERDQELRAPPRAGINDCSTYVLQGESDFNYADDF